jgi:hypothetical protein
MLGEIEKYMRAGTLNPAVRPVTGRKKNAGSGELCDVGHRVTQGVLE